MKYYTVNLAYENELYGEPIKKHLNDAFDYLLFWCQEEQSTLVTKNVFSNDYLDFVAHYSGFECLYTKDSSNSQNWWGKLSDIDKERKLNSKIFLNESLKKLDILEVDSFVVNTYEELKSLQKNKNTKKPRLVRALEYIRNMVLISWSFSFFRLRSYTGHSTSKPDKVGCHILWEIASLCRV